MGFNFNLSSLPVFGLYGPYCPFDYREEYQNNPKCKRKTAPALKKSKRRQKQFSQRRNRG